MIGKKLAHFEIESKLGQGGMGEVYRARDTRLKRTVAIKVLPADLAMDPERRERLQREAQTISSLNHPHVCTLYDLGNDDGVDFLVLEHLEGVPLSDRLASGPLPLTEALGIAAQIADGLDAAHRLGIVHRDLKPANVMLTKSGAKLLDFGLAKEIAGQSQGVDVTAGLTQPVSGGSITSEGTILGTLQYMAPEQLHGEPVDARSDMFSFGAMLYEMVTGVAPFQGKSQASVIASILEKEPTPLSDHTQLAPSSLDRLVRRCLEKDPDARLQNARDAMHELKWIAANPTEVSAQSQEPETSKKRTGMKVWQVAMAVALLALLAERFLLPQLFPPKAVDSPIQPMVRAMIDLPEGHRLAGWASPTVAISDDGSTIAFVTQSESVPANQLWVRDLGASESKLVPESISAEGPTFSPDGKWVLFAVGVSGTKPQGVTRGLKKYSLETGLTQDVCDTRDFFGASWGKDGTIIYADQLPKGLWQVNAAGGTGNNFLKAAKVQEKSYSSLAWPQLLDVPNKSLVRLQGGSAFLRLGILNLESGAFSDLNIRATATAPISKNRLAYVDPKGTLLVAPLNTATESVNQSGIAVDRDISIAGAGAAVFAVSKNGTAIFSRGAVRGNRRNLRQLKIVKDKSSITLPLEPNYFAGMAASPDGEFFATVLDGKIRVTELKGLTETVLPLGKVEGPMALRWSPDGKWLAFRGMDGGTTLDVFVIAVDGSSEPRRIFKAPSEAAPRSWFPSSRELLVHDFALDGERLRLFRVPFDGEPTEVKIEPLSDARLSPDGSVLLYLERQGTRPALVMRSFPDLGPKVRVLPGDDWRAVWSRDGSKVFAFGSEEAVEVDITREPFLAASQPRSILTNPGSYVWPHLSADGFGGFYVMEDVPGSGIVTQLEIISNWADNMPTFE